MEAKKNNAKEKTLWIFMSEYDLKGTNTCKYYLRAKHHGIDFRLFISNMCEIKDRKLYYKGKLVKGSPAIVYSRSFKFKELSQYLRRLPSRIINRPNGVQSLGPDKWTTFKALDGHDIPQPKSAAYNIPPMFESVATKLGAPFVAKPKHGAGGLGVTLVHNKEEYNKLFENYQIKDYIFQEYINASFGQDIRSYIMGDKVVGVMKRVGAKDFRSNISLGATAFKHKLTKEQEKLALKIARLLGGEIISVDFLINGKDLIFCEANTCPQFYGFQELGGYEFENETIDFINTVFEKEFGITKAEENKNV